MATEPITVIEPEPFAPLAIVKPAIVERVTVPAEAYTVSESEPAPGPESATRIAFPFAEEKLTEPFVPTAAEEGAVMVGELTMRLMLFDADSLSPASAIEIVNEARPE